MLIYASIWPTLSGIVKAWENTALTWLECKWFQSYGQCSSIHMLAEDWLQGLRFHGTYWVVTLTEDKLSVPCHFSTEQRELAFQNVCFFSSFEYCGNPEIYLYKELQVFQCRESNGHTCSQYVKTPAMGASFWKGNDFGRLQWECQVDSTGNNGRVALQLMWYHTCVHSNEQMNSHGKPFTLPYSPRTRQRISYRIFLGLGATWLHFLSIFERKLNNGLQRNQRKLKMEHFTKKKSRAILQIYTIINETHN